MGNVKREFIIRELMVPGFIIHEGSEIFLEETGRSILCVRLASNDNLCISNVDKKKTDFLFFQEGKTKSLYKRVDHMIFEDRGNNQWKLHLIEMKGSVGEEKWIEIKGKFRASYLLAQAIAGMLELEISETVMYTTYQRVEFRFSETMPTARRGRPGRPVIRMKDEWESIQFGLNFEERIPFTHVPIQMTKNADDILTGNLCMD